MRHPGSGMAFQFSQHWWSTLGLGLKWVAVLRELPARTLCIVQLLLLPNAEVFTVAIGAQFSAHHAQHRAETGRGWPFFVIPIVGTPGGAAAPIRGIPNRESASDRESTAASPRASCRSSSSSIASCRVYSAIPALLGGADMEERNGSTGSTSQAVNHGHHGHHDRTTTPPRPPAPALPSSGTGWWCWRRADDWAVVVERVAVLLGRWFRVVAPPLAPRSIARLSSFSAPRHVDAHTLGAIDWLRSDCPDDFEPSQTHKVGV